MLCQSLLLGLFDRTAKGLTAETNAARADSKEPFQQSVLCERDQSVPSPTAAQQQQFCRQQGSETQPSPHLNSLSCRTRRALLLSCTSEQTARCEQDWSSGHSRASIHPCSELGVFLDPSSWEEAPTPVYIVIGHHQCCQLLFAVPCLVVNAQMHNISPTSQRQAQLYSRGSSVVFTALTPGFGTLEFSCNRREPARNLPVSDSNTARSELPFQSCNCTMNTCFIKLRFVF